MRETLAKGDDVAMVLSLHAQVRLRTNEINSESKTHSLTLGIKSVLTVNNNRLGFL